MKPDARNFVYVRIICEEVYDTDSFWSFTTHLAILLQMWGDSTSGLPCISKENDSQEWGTLWLINEGLSDTCFGIFLFLLLFPSYSSHFSLFCYLPSHSLCFFIFPLPPVLFLILHFLFFNYLCLLCLTFFFLSVLLSVIIAVVN